MSDRYNERLDRRYVIIWTELGRFEWGVGGEESGLPTSTGYTSPSWYEFMCPSGRRPFGNRDKRTNSGRVRSSSRDSVNRVPLYMHVSSEART